MPCEHCSTLPGWESGRAPTGFPPKRTSGAACWPAAWPASPAGLVESEQGRGGGSRLARPAREITLRDAVEAAEGPFGITRCIMQNRACGTDAPCAIHDAWEEGQQAILEYLQKQSLEDFITQNPSGRFPPKA